MKERGKSDRPSTSFPPLRRSMIVLNYSLELFWSIYGWRSADLPEMDDIAFREWRRGKLAPFQALTYFGAGFNTKEGAERVASVIKQSTLLSASLGGDM